MTKRGLDCRSLERLRGLRREQLEQGIIQRPAIGNPVECSESAEFIEGLRRPRCKTHSACLSFAALMEWDGFACVRCDVVDEYDEKSVQGAIDREGTARLIREAYPELFMARPVDVVDDHVTRAEMRALIPLGRLWTRQQRRKRPAKTMAMSGGGDR